MLGRARKVLEDWGGDFVFTGEVLGQRPMSQRRWAMQKVEEVSGLHDRLLRPLSAKLMAPIAAERAGQVDRERLLGFSGRGRKPQIDLARRMGLTDFPQPAGGCCYLADEGYGRRFKDLLDHRPERTITNEEATLLAAGRHFRLSEGTKLIVARNDSENAVLERYMGERFHVMASEVLGPVGLVEGTPTPEERTMASQIVARYGKGKGEPTVTVQWKKAGILQDELTVTPLDASLDLGNILL
jgi:tRNA U34 2-thiouridine synthase MnmA/TrmU